MSNKHFPGLLLLLDWFLEGGGGKCLDISCVQELCQRSSNLQWIVEVIDSWEHATDSHSQQCSLSRGLAQPRDRHGHGAARRLGGCQAHVCHLSTLCCAR